MKTILIAEDTDSNFLLLSIILRKTFLLKRAFNGLEAVELFKKEKPDLILMDIKMPFLDGLGATREIRKTGSDIPIIVLTANAFDCDRQKSLHAGATDYMAKPIIATDLMALIRKYLPE